MGCSDSLYDHKHCQSHMFNIHIPQLFSDKGHHHDQGKGKIQVTVGTLVCSVLQSTGVDDGMGNTCGHLKHSLYNKMVTRSSLDTL
jgi:hypothetical protein